MTDERIDNLLDTFETRYSLEMPGGTVAQAHFRQLLSDFVDELEKPGYRLPPKLKLIGDEEIRAELTRIQPEGFNWGEITKSESVKFRAIANLQKDADQKAIEEQAK